MEESTQITAIYSKLELQANRRLIVVALRGIAWVLLVEADLGSFCGDFELLPIDVVVDSDTVPFSVAVAGIQVIIPALVAEKELQAADSNLAREQITGFYVAPP
jgi:hypothetical protein